MEDTEEYQCATRLEKYFEKEIGKMFSFRLTVFYCKPNYVHLADGLNILLESSYLSYYL